MPIALGLLAALFIGGGALVLRDYLDDHRARPAHVSIPEPVRAPKPAVDAPAPPPPQPPVQITVRIVSDPPGATVCIIDEGVVLEGVTPFSHVRPVKAGAFKVTLTLAGYREVTRELSPTRDSELVIVLVEDPAAAAAEKAKKPAPEATKKATKKAAKKPAKKPAKKAKPRDGKDDLLPPKWR
jgi:hypothetical protein